MKGKLVVLSFKVPTETRRLVEVLAARWTLKSGKRHTLTDVITAGIHLLARKEKNITES